MRKYIICTLLLVAAVNPSVIQAQEAKTVDKSAEFFFYRCAGCHTVGGGNLTGPDLAKSTQWVESDLHSAIKRMEKNVGPLTDVQISDLILFLKDRSVADRIAQQKKRMEASLLAELPAPSFETGMHLFRGDKLLKNGGPSCISCHFFVKEGGSLGPDLTSIKAKMSGVALQSAIENSSYKVMRAIYANHKITKEESVHLAEFLSHPEQNDQRGDLKASDISRLSMIGVGLFIVVLWRLNRNRKGRTRENLIEKSKRGSYP